jgi:serine/threonine-protein kinase HipA
MEREALVFADLDRTAHPLGRLWVREKNGRETATFEYDPAWLKRAGAFALAPSLPLTAGSFFSDKGLFGAFTDPAPDRWGQKLMRHYERDRATKAGTQPRALLAADFLLGVDDETRLGALRFKLADGGDFVSRSHAPVPPLIELKNLLSATDRIEKGRERKTDLALVLAPGGSLGGARPKATVRDRDGRLHVAKFPWVKDDWPVIPWEITALDLAKAAAISVPEYRLEMVGQKPVLLMARFDRIGVDVRVPFMSAMTALDAKDHDEGRSYLEIVDILRQIGGAPAADIAQLWRRMVFNILISNTDDHLRNHGFLWAPGGWRLSPAFDLNPSPLDVGGGIHVLALNEMDTSASLDTALSIAPYFGLKQPEAAVIAHEVALAVANWRKVATSNKIARADIDRMASAFDHADLEKALALATRPPAAKPRNPAKKAPSKVARKPTEAVKAARTARKPQGKKSV